MSAVIDAWSGPFGAPQDFQFPEGDALEVKAIRLAADRIKISSVQQLEPEEFTSLELAVLAVENSSYEGPHATTLPILAGKIRDLVAGDHAALEALDARFSHLGFNEYDSAYQELFFGFHPIRHYRVGDNFPRLKQIFCPPGVDRVTYEISLNAISSFAIDKGISAAEVKQQTSEDGG